MARFAWRALPPSHAARGQWVRAAWEGVRTHRRTTVLLPPASRGVLEHTPTPTDEPPLPPRREFESGPAAGGGVSFRRRQLRLRFVARRWALAYYPAVLLRRPVRDAKFCGLGLVGPAARRRRENLGFYSEKRGFSQRKTRFFVPTPGFSLAELGLRKPKPRLHRALVCLHRDSTVKARV